mgnify:CR=1 FL=1
MGKRKFSEMSKEEKQKMFYIVLISILVIALIASVIATIVVVTGFPSFEEISYSEYVKKLDSGEIVAAKFTKDHATLLYEKHKDKHERFKAGNFCSAKVSFKDENEAKEAMDLAKQKLLSNTVIVPAKPAE